MPITHGYLSGMSLWVRGLMHRIEKMWIAIEKINFIDESFKKNPDALAVEGYTDGDNTPLLSHATKNKVGGEYPTCNMAFKKEILEKVADDNYRDAMTHAIPIVKNASVMDW